MANSMRGPLAESIDQYISDFPNDVQQKLQAIRAAIAKAAPTAVEGIKYAMPTFMLEGNLVHFAAFKNHIGFYPAPNGITGFEKELSIYATSKGAVRFPLDKPLPIGLITKIVKFRVKDNLDRVKLKSAKSRKS